MEVYDVLLAQQKSISKRKALGLEFTQKSAALDEHGGLKVFVILNSLTLGQNPTSCF